MAEVLVACAGGDAAAQLEALHGAAKGTRCLILHRVRWLESFVAEDGARLVSRFRAPDAESVRIALRGLGSARIWRATVHLADDSTRANLVIERRLAEPGDGDGMRALLRQAAGRLGSLRPLLAMSSADRFQLLCVAEVPREDALRLADGDEWAAGTRAWPCRRIAPSR